MGEGARVKSKGKSQKAKVKWDAECLERETLLKVSQMPNLPNEPDRALGAFDSALHEHFGFTAFRAGQREAIAAVMAARDALVVMPTGAGKSLCYQLPALVLPHTTLVVSPLIALMKDQVDALSARGKRAVFINSTLSADEQQNRLRMLARGWYKIVYVAPERLRNADFLSALKPTRVALLAVDEAHCISQWGHDFRPDYLHIREFANAIGRPPMLALTATATPEVQRDIIAQLGLTQPERIITGFNRPNIALRVRYTPKDADKLRELDALLRDERGSTIIYAGTRRDTEEIAAFCLDVLKIPAEFYHAGLDDERRARVQERFMRGDTQIIVATNAFGMGVDKPDIRNVIHYALPSTVEAYYQEVGRAGRDGKPARGILLYSPEDRALQEWFIENDAPEPQKILQLHRWLTRAALNAPKWFAPNVLQKQTGMPDHHVRSALQQLEWANVLRRVGDVQGKIGIEVISTAPPDLRASTARVEQQRAHKRQLLAQMIEYAETNKCRRQFILDYFGDPSRADAPDCCDNHVETAPSAARRAASDAEWIPLVILEAVRTVKRQVGRDKIAQIVHGSRAQDILQWRYNRHKFYGKLKHLTLREIGDVIEQLIARGYLKTIGGEFPVIALTPLGEKTLAARAAIALNVASSATSQKHAEKKATLKAGGTVERTLELAQQGLNVAQIAAQRGLTIGTIYAHLERLVAEGKIAPERFIEPSVREQILAAMQQWDGQFLSGLKELLPEEISYDQIRFVVAAQKAKQ
jgi:ATP-dependent DNA helicase RecQ